MLMLTCICKVLNLVVSLLSYCSRINTIQQLFHYYYYYFTAVSIQLELLQRRRCCWLIFNICSFVDSLHHSYLVRLCCSVPKLSWKVENSRISFVASCLLEGRHLPMTSWRERETDKEARMVGRPKIVL